jgi:hypothetical protein
MNHLGEWHGKLWRSGNQDPFLWGHIYGRTFISMEASLWGHVYDLHLSYAHPQKAPRTMEIGQVLL